SGDDEEYQRIYTTKIKPRLRSEEGPEAEAGGTQSRTITVTRRVTAYTVDVSSSDGDLGVIGGPELNVCVPAPGADVRAGPGGLAGTPEGLHLRTEPQSQIPGGETGKSLPGWKGAGAFPGSPRIEANGQFGELDGSLHAAGLDGQGHVAGGAPCPQGEFAGSSPAVDGGKIKIPTLKIPKFGFQAGGEAPAPQVDIGMDVTCSPTLDVSCPSGKAQVDMAVKDATKVPSSPLDVPGVEVPAPDGAKGKIKIPHLAFPKFSAQGGLEVSGPKVDIEAPSLDIQGPEMHLKAPKISMPDVDLTLNGAKASGDLDVSVPGLKGPELDIKGPKVEVEAPDLDIQGPEGKLKFPKLKMPKFGAKGESPDLEVALPKGGVDVSCPGVAVEVPGVDLKGPKVKVPEVSLKTPQISMPDIDLNLKGPKVKADLDVSTPKLEGELKTPGLDIKGPKVEVEAPDLDVQGPEGKLKFPKLKMPKFGAKGESPDLEATLPKGEMDISAPKVDIDVPSVDVEGPEVDVEVPDVHLEGPEAKLKMPKMKLPHFNVSGPKLEGAEVDVTLPKGEVDVSGPEVDVEGPEVDVGGAEGKWKGPKFR
ncbi:AHNK protein, partial [Chloropsis hardwickii]|nr:AHNK protein [Chloropsis hardwickii]